MLIGCDQDFAAHFSDVTHHFDIDFDVFMGDEQISREDFAEILQQARTSTIRLRLKRFALERDAETASGEYDSVYLPRPTKYMSIFEKIGDIEIGRLSRESYNEADDSDVLFWTLAGEAHQLHESWPQSSENASADSSAPDEQDGAQALPSGDSCEQFSVREEDTDNTDQGEQQRRNFECRTTENCNLSVDSSSEDGPNCNLVFSLPKDFTQAAVLKNLGIRFTEKAQGFILQDGLDKARLLDVIWLTKKLEILAQLRVFINASLDMRLDGADDDKSPDTQVSEPPSVEAAEDLPLETHDRGLFNESTLYQACPSMTYTAFRDNLDIWQSRPFDHVSMHEDRTDGFSTTFESDNMAFCKLLGFSEVKRTDMATGRRIEHSDEPQSDLLEPFVFGLRLLMYTSQLDKLSTEVRMLDEKLPSAVFELVALLIKSLEKAVELIPAVFLNRAMRSFTQLFDVLNILACHELTIQFIHHDRGQSTTAAQCQVILKHMVTAILLATRALTELEGHGSLIEAEVVRRKTSLIETSSLIPHGLNYDRVKECCRRIYSATDPTVIVCKEESQLQTNFDQNVVTLVDLGWEKEAASAILLHECRWERVTQHADSAARMIEARYVAVLHADPAKKFDSKAAALPTDMVALLLSRLLWRPVVDGRDALDMYWQYTSDLVSSAINLTQQEEHAKKDSGNQHPDRRAKS